jgi:uncharacterized repeat protein (TIGR01451 family)
LLLILLATAVASAQTATTTTLSVDNNPSLFGQTVTLTARISTGGEISKAATGTVTFSDGNTVLGSVNVNPDLTTPGFPISTLGVGTHPLTASYSGDSNYGMSTSTAVSQVVKVPPGTPESITITSSPTGAAFTVSGTGCNAGSYTTPKTLSWPSQTQCSVTFVSPQFPQSGVEYVFSGWSDVSSANPRTITTPDQAATYTAVMNTLYLLTATPSPAAGGTVTGSGVYYATGSTVTLTATAASGYHLTAWSGASPVANTSTATVTIGNAASVVTAIFGANGTAPSVNYTIAQILMSASAPAGKSINSFGQVVGTSAGLPSVGLLWTPSQQHGGSGTVSGLGVLTGFEAAATNAAAINDYGQVVGTTGTEAFLSQPTAPNSTSMAMVAFLGSQSPGSTAVGINSFGQIIGSLAVGSYLWTPLFANGTSGTNNTNGQFGGVSGLNDFGQAIIPSQRAPFVDTLLFTPASPHGQGGTFALVANLEPPVAINASATILMAPQSCSGAHCTAAGLDLWTPAVANAAIGSVSHLLPADGPASPVAYAFNTAGQLVGMRGYDATSGLSPFQPFLYSAGTAYDLSQLSGWPIGGVPVGLNDFGEIVVNANGNVYMLTPQSALPTPQWTITETHTGSFAPGQNGVTYTIKVTNSGTAATSGTVTVVENVPNGLTLVSMSGSGWTCSVNSCNRSDALTPTAAHPTITVTMNVNAVASSPLTNQATVSGGGAALSTASDPTTIAGTVLPAPVSISPIVSTGASQTYVFQFSDVSGYQSLSVVNVLINNFLDGRSACYLAYAVPTNVLYLVPDNGTGLLPGLALNGVGNLSNSQCTINGAQSSASGSGNVLTLTLSITFTPSFAGNKLVYMAARDLLNNSGWQTMGTHGVPPLPTAFPNPISVSPSFGNTANAVLTFVYQDATSASNFQTMWALTNTALDGRSACYIAYYAPGNQVLLVPDNGDGTQAVSMTLGGTTGSLTNSQCTVFAQGSSAVKSGAQITLTLNITFKPSFAGPKAIWMAAETLDSTVSPWQSLGAWTVPGN